MECSTMRKKVSFQKVVDAFSAEWKLFLGWEYTDDDDGIKEIISKI